MLEPRRTALIAAQPTPDGVTVAVKSAPAMPLELQKAVKDFRRKWRWVVAGLLGTVMVAASSVV